VTTDSSNGGGPSETAKDSRGRAYTRPRGFAAMDRAKVAEIAAKGGKSAHKQGRAHEFTSESARIAGRKGGRATKTKKAAAREAKAALLATESQTIDEKPTVG